MRGMSEAEIERVRLRAETLIAEVLTRTWGLPEIDIMLELGKACPFTSPADRGIWIAEINRQRAGV